ncbi:S-layer homology domain-containing protein [Clostridium sp. BNL1100]|uniref:S-layer homology domain-containing protein n=1 Tax=Clostridium sp. BNL1100 TaxID=755731 RepID=UPI00024A7831|nr:S-layer homology domain-containing protein [Clostridium sp. BNL1100]AEY66539.1 putative S-layer protein [Clostridium sp. BNL1100]
MHNRKAKFLSVALSAVMALSTLVVPFNANAASAPGQYIIGDGSGGGGGGASGSNFAGGAGGNGGGDNDTINGTIGSDVIFGDGSGGGAGCRSVGGSINPRGGVGGGGADIINGGDGDDVIFGDGFNGQDYLGWYPGNGGIGGGGAGGAGGIFGQPPAGGIGGIGGGGGGAGGSGACIPGATLITGVGNSGGIQSGTNGGTGGASTTSNENGVPGAGGAPSVYAGGGGAGFGGAAGGAGANNANGLTGANGDTNQHTYNDTTGSVRGYFTESVLRTLLLNNPTFGAGNDTINGGAGNNNLFGLGGQNTFIVDSADNASRTVIWDLKYGDKLLLQNDGVLVSQVFSESVLEGASYGDFDGDGFDDDTRIMFNSNPIDLIDNLLSKTNNVGTNGEISPSNSAPVIDLNNNINVYNLGSGFDCWFGAGAVVNDRDGDQDWDGGKMEVKLEWNATENDQLGVFENSTLAPIIAFSGTDVTAAGVSIGTMSVPAAAGANTAKYLVSGNTLFTVTFNSNATNEYVRKLVNHLLFKSINAGNGNRVVSVKLTDKHGNSSMDTEVIGANVPAAAPVFQSAATDTSGSKVIAVFDKTMMARPDGRQGQFTVTVDGSPAVVTSIANADFDSTLEFTLATPVVNGQIVKISYATGSIISADTGVLATFGLQDVVNNVPALYTVPGVPQTVKAVAGNAQATVTFNAPASDGGSPITGYIVTSTPGSITATGNTNSIIVTGLTNGTTYTFTVKAVNAAGEGNESAPSNQVTPSAPSSGGGDSTGTPSTPATPTPSDTGVEILVNGKVETAATATKSEQNGKSVLTLTVDDKKVEQKIEQEGNNAVVTIPVRNSSDIVVSQLTGQTVKYMETKNSVLKIQTDNVTYTIQASQINIDNVSEKIGKQVELKDINVEIKISASPDSAVKTVETTAKTNNYQVMVKPVDFDITCSNGDKTIDVTRFNAYVERMVAIPDGIDPNKITTGIVLNADGSFSHVPTVINKIDNRYYAKINSITNSTYSVIWSPKTFDDVENHWAKAAVNDMGSRLIISGVGNGKFAPQRDITRAEFATIVVKGLGLMCTGTGKDTFNDVAKGTWYYDAVSIASEYGIISGYGYGKFGPMDRISREQAMTIIAKAMDITGLNIELTQDEQASILSGFKDSEIASGYAITGIAACVKSGIVTGRGNNMVAPKSDITRAETAVIVRKLLQKSELINQ